MDHGPIGDDGVLDLCNSHLASLQEGYIAESLSHPLSSLGYLLIFTSFVMALVWYWPQDDDTTYRSSYNYDYLRRLHGRGGRQRQRYRRSVGDYAEMFAAMVGEGARTFESIKRLPWYHKKFHYRDKERERRAKCQVRRARSDEDEQQGSYLSDVRKITGILECLPLSSRNLRQYGWCSSQGFQENSEAKEI